MDTTGTPEQRREVIVVINTLGAVESQTLSRWLAKGTAARAPAPSGLAERILRALDIDVSLDSAAALRRFGQTGEHVQGFLAAADPVYLEPRLDHLCLHTLSGRLRDGELPALVGYLNERLGDTVRFDTVSECAYLQTDEIPTAGFDADALHGFVPNEFLPSGAGAADYRRLQSEIEMALHDHPVNQKRHADGLQPVNSLWVWGGGTWSECKPAPLPPLLGDDPLLRGLWSACAAEHHGWPGSIESAATRGVVIVPENDDLSPDDRIDSVKRLFDASQASTLKLLTRDGVAVTLRRADRFKFWRRELELPAFAP